MPKLTTRVKPTQKRAKEKVDLILNTAITLLGEVGSDGFTTKLLAERANIPCRNIYRYFPNKHAIITTLAKIMADRELTYFNEFEFIKNRELSWDQAIDLTFDTYIEAALSEPALMAVRNAMRGSPDLQDIDEQSKQKFASQFYSAIKVRGTKISEYKLNLLCLTIIYIFYALTDLALSEYNNSKDIARSFEVLEELKHVLKAYLQDLENTEK